MPLEHGIVDWTARVPLTADAIALLASVGVVVGIEWSEGGRAAIIRRLLETHPDVLRTAKAQGKTRAQVVKMFDIRRGVRVVKEKDGVK